MKLEAMYEIKFIKWYRISSFLSRLFQRLSPHSVLMFTYSIAKKILVLEIPEI